MKDTDAIDQARQRRGAELAADLRDAISFPPLLPSPAEVGDLILQTREHVQALGWGNREQLYTASQVRALMSECAVMAAARERERTMFSRRPGLWALQAREVLELIAAPMRPDGTWNRDREACRQMAAEALGRYDDYGLTFELRGRKRRHHSPSKPQNVTAVCGPFERGVSPAVEKAR